MRGTVIKRCPCPKTAAGGAKARPCTKAHGSWSYKHDAPDGAGRRQVMVGGFGTRREAETALAEALTKVGRGEVVATAMALGAYLDQWLVGMRAQLAVTAWSNYAKLLHLYVPDTLRCRPLGKLTGPMLTTHYGELVERGGRGGRSLSPTTVRLVHRILHKALADAVDAGAMGQVGSVGGPALQRKEPPLPVDR